VGEAAAAAAEGEARATTMWDGIMMPLVLRVLGCSVDAPLVSSTARCDGAGWRW
jgi:hypothetical protein